METKQEVFEIMKDHCWLANRRNLDECSPDYTRRLNALNQFLGDMSERYDAATTDIALKPGHDLTIRIRSEA